ncbi:MAG TPA: hypothetical protein VHS57_02330 [Acidimicrobiales bacterium]|jgi:hypothetical protein|nr:hypothetical protein [Acidimicrobiales bacterium]
MASALVLVAPATASNIAFYAIFGVFVAAMLVLIGIIVVWAVRHDIAGRRAWQERHQSAATEQNPPRAEP